MTPEVAIILVFYFLPAMAAAGRRHHNQSAIFILNLLLGWTILGWIAALVWAFTFVEPRKHEGPFDGVWEKLWGRAR